MNKSEFNTFLRKVISKSPCNRHIRADWAEILMPMLKQSKLYTKQANKPNIQLKCVYRKYGPRKSKFLALVDDANKELIIGKAKLIESLYPTKSKKTKEQKHREQILCVLRRIIEPQIKSFRAGIKSQIQQLAESGLIQSAKDLNKCKLTGKSLNSCKTAVDHIIPFIQLVDEWLKMLGITFGDIKLKGRGHNKYFEDAELMQNWYEYHEQNAKLQMVCSRANSSAGKKGYTSL